MSSKQSNVPGGGVGGGGRKGRASGAAGAMTTGPATAVNPAGKSENGHGAIVVLKPQPHSKERVGILHGQPHDGYPRHRPQAPRRGRDQLPPGRALGLSPCRDGGRSEHPGWRPPPATVRRSGSASATATATAAGIPVQARSPLRSRACARAATSPPSWSHGAAASRPSWPSSSRPTS